VLRPQVRYARAADGAAIAYAAIGSGPVTIVMVSPLISQLELAWEEPTFEHFFTRLGVGARVVLFDRRGSGLSDHAVSSTEQLSLPRLAGDVAAVLDAVGAPRTAVLAASLGGPIAIRFAVDHPTRTSALVLIATSPRLTRATGYDAGMDPTGVDAWVDAVVDRWGQGASVEADGPSMAGNERYREWAARLERHTASPGGVHLAVGASFAYDVRPLLPAVRVPTLVIHRTDDPGAPVEHGRYLAAHIPGAAYVELAGAEHTYFLGDHDTMLGTVRDFLDAHVAGGSLQAASRRAERRNAYGSGWEALTPSEREVALLAAQGLTNADIASRLGRSRHTIDGRLRRVFHKLGISTRVDLAAEVARLDR
jgi:pimeloyl-ACP methyl ester carboxylesterase/DNA-binding CsgD family transcriptional regulator